MDFYRNVTFSGDYHHHQNQVLLSPSNLTPLDDLLSAQNTEVDVSMEWLSVFVEDCLSSTGNCLPPAPISSTPNNNTTPPKPQQNTLLKRSSIPVKARSKRKRVTSLKSRNRWSYGSNKTLHFPISDSPLLHHNQAHWLADSELIMPKKEGVQVEEEEREVSKESNLGGNNQGRRCSHCLAHKTPQWRAGPLGPKTLCNACGVRYKSGRLLPEYRPAKSPTFVSYLHSNSHKKVLEMRSLSTSSPSSSSLPPLFNS